MGVSALVRRTLLCSALSALVCAPAAAWQSASFDDLAAQATAARRANRIPEAIDLYRQAVAARSSWLEGWWFLGTLSYAGYRYGDSAPVAVIEFVDRDVDAKGLDSGPAAEQKTEPEAAAPA